MSDQNKNHGLFVFVSIAILAVSIILAVFIAQNLQKIKKVEEQQEIDKTTKLDKELVEKTRRSVANFNTTWNRITSNDGLQRIRVVCVSCKRDTRIPNIPETDKAIKWGCFGCMIFPEEYRDEIPVPSFKDMTKMTPLKAEAKALP